MLDFLFSEDLLFVNLGYLLMFIGLAVSDILWLRALLMGGQICLVASGVFLSNHSVVFWNSVFLAINSVQLMRVILRRKRVAIPQDIADLYQTAFSAMTPKEFLTFWNKGVHSSVDSETLVEEGLMPERLLMITDGKAEVRKEGILIAVLQRGSFAAEMSFISGEAASAHVIAHGQVTFVSWSQVKLHKLKTQDADLFTKLQGILGRDLSRKVRQQSHAIEARFTAG